MQKTGSDAIEFVKAAPPDFKNPASCPALVLNADFRPPQLLPAIALVLARYAESSGLGPRQYRVALRYSGAFALNRIYTAQRCFIENLCEAAAPSGLHPL